MWLFSWKVELGSRAGALKQMLLDILEDTPEIRRICIMGRNCTLNKENSEMECSVPLEKQIAEGEEHIDLSMVLPCSGWHTFGKMKWAIWSYHLLFLACFSFAEEEEEIEMLLENYLQRSVLMLIFLHVKRWNLIFPFTHIKHKQSQRCFLQTT